MSTLVENVAKVTAAHAALKTAIAAKGVAVPDGTKLSGMPALVEQIQTGGSAPSPVGWGRPADWPRVDLIEIGKTDPDVCYFIVQKPSDTVNHGFCLLANTSDGNPWRMERISVAADGSTVDAIAGTEQTANSGAYIDFQFPDSDPACSVYAVRVASPTGGHFSSLGFYKPPSAHTYDKLYFISGIVLEAIVHQTSARYLTFGSGTWGYLGPQHIVYTGCPNGPLSYLFRGLEFNLHLVEFRKGSLMEVIDSEQPRFTCAETILEMDDDVEIRMTTGNKYTSPFIKPNSFGKIDTLGRFVDKSTGLPVDWSAVNASRCFNNCYPLISVSLPAGFGSAATSLAGCFNKCVALTSLSLPAGFGQAATNVSRCFYGCVSLVSLVLPTGFGQAVTNLGSCFYGCLSLADITGNPNFKASLDLSGCTKLTHDSLMVVINGLQTVTTTQKLMLGSNLLDKLTDDEKKVATDKGWTLA